MDSMRRIAIAGLAAAAVAATPALAADPAPTAPATTQPVYTQLSNRTTVTRWAYFNWNEKVRKSPSYSSKAIGTLHVNTEDGPPEVYLALQLYTDANGNQWVQTQLPGRPNGRIGWVPRDGLGEFHTIHTQVVVDRRKLRITLYKNGRAIFKAPVGVGKPSTPTPAGKFWIREKLRGAPGYGPIAFGTAAYSNTITEFEGAPGVVGIHGTDQPQLVPGRPSHGCIRMRNADVVKLARLLGRGSPPTGAGTPLLIK